MFQRGDWSIHQSAYFSSTIHLFKFGFTNNISFEWYSEGKFKDVTFGGQRSAHICPCNCYLKKCSQSTSSSSSPSPSPWPSSPWPLSFSSLLQLDFNSWPQDREEQGAQGKAHQGRSWPGPAWRTARSEVRPEQDCFLLWLAALRAVKTAFTQALALNCCKHWYRTFHWEYALVAILRLLSIPLRLLWMFCKIVCLHFNLCLANDL